jgi:16S rRNA (uracil1498-N3)-methyltransferase
LRVLRIRSGELLTLFNGSGGEYSAELTMLERRQTLVRILRHHHHEVESPLRLTLIQGISKGERMDFTIQKAVELGVDRIIPVFTRRSVVQLDSDRLAKRLEHWRGIIISACEQCGRNRLPALLPARPLHESWCDTATAIQLVLNPKGAATLTHIKPGTPRITLLVGPEGGLTDEEISQAECQGFQSLRLGPRILRTETAGVAVLSALQVIAGDLG